MLPTEIVVSEVNVLASMGGKAAAANMTAAERKERARKAAETRWGASSPQALFQGAIKLGNIEIPCAVLDDETRVLTQRGVFVALGRNKNPNTGHSAIDGKPGFLAAKNLEPFISDELRRSWEPIRFRLKDGSGGVDGKWEIDIGSRP